MSATDVHALVHELEVHQVELEIQNGLPDAVPAAARGAGLPIGIGSDLSGARVLVVDDDLDVANGVRVLLGLKGAEVRIICDGHAALDTCDTWWPTAVLMDLGMPGMDGFEAARRLCERDPDRPFRVIAKSGWGQHEDRREALAPVSISTSASPLGSVNSAPF